MSQQANAQVEEGSGRTGAEDNSVVLQQVTSEIQELKKSLDGANDRLVEMGKQVRARRRN